MAKCNSKKNRKIMCLTSEKKFGKIGSWTNNKYNIKNFKKLNKS